MDEADKYKQRLEAIAEKHRLQEEQDRARREMEDEKLRLQQLKRKSLRDQWLMEAAPLSPSSPDTQSPRSPLWGSQAQEIEKRIDKLQSESQRLAEEEEKLKEQMEDSQMEAVKAAEAGAEIVQDAVVQNGDNGNNATGLDTTEYEVKVNQSPLLDETAAVLTNGRGEIEAGTHHDDSEQSNRSTTNGPLVASEGVVSMKLEPGLSMGVSDAQPGPVPNVNINENEEEEEGTLMMRAECVIITDEGDDVSEDLAPLEGQQETRQLEETPLSNPEAGTEGLEAVDEEVKTGASPETSPQPEKSEATEHNKQSDDPTSVQVPSPASALEGTTVAPAPVPVYPEVQPSALTPELEAGGESAITLEGAEATIKAHDPDTLLGQFQEVPLTDPEEKQRTEAGLEEQEPLLLQAKASVTTAGPAAAAAAANSPASTETHSPTKASQEEETNAPKHKTCQCCSVM